MKNYSTDNRTIITGPAGVGRGLAATLALLAFAALAGGAGSAFGQAVEIPAGAHTVAIAYRTPGLTAGLALSGGCLAVSILWLLVRKRRG